MKELLRTTCILCPNGCEVSLAKKNDEYAVTGNFCKKGVQYAINEYEHPVRTVTSTVRTSSRKVPRISVKTDSPISKEKIFDVMQLLDTILVDEPTHCGDVISENILGTNVSIVATSDWMEV